LIILRAAALRANLHNTAGFFYCIADVLSVAHRIGEWFFDVGVFPGAYGGDAVLGMLKVGCRDEHCINIFTREKFVVVAGGCDVRARDFRDVRDAFFTAQLPDVACAGKFKIQLGSMLVKGWKQSVPEPL